MLVVVYAVDVDVYSDQMGLLELSPLRRKIKKDGDGAGLYPPGGPHSHMWTTDSDPSGAHNLRTLHPLTASSALYPWYHLLTSPSTTQRVPSKVR